MSTAPYPVWWETTITIYNRYEDPNTQVVRWFSHVVNNCFWKYVGDKISINNVTLETNNTICRIPKDPKFLEKYQWIKLPNDMMENYYTLGRGDIIVRGEVTDVIDEYTTGTRSTDLIAKYKELQGCIEVEEVAINTGRGRNNEHYFVKGI